MMVSLVLYPYYTNVRSSRTIERHCHQDIAFRVITANLCKPECRRPERVRAEYG